MDTDQGIRIFKSARSVAVFFARFIAASIVLYLAYAKFGRYYAMLIANIAKPLVGLFHYEMNVQNVLNVVEDISLNPVVFLSLVIAIGNGRMIKELVRAAIVGVLILTVLNSLTIFLSFLSEYRGSERLWLGTEFFNLTINFFVPLLLWFVLLPMRSVLPLKPAGR